MILDLGDWVIELEDYYEVERKSDRIIVYRRVDFSKIPVLEIKRKR